MRSKSTYLVLLVVGGCAFVLSRFALTAPPKPPKIPVAQSVRTAALGNLRGVPAAERRHFELKDGFEPLGTPESNEWLARHEEYGQTFDQYRRSNHPDARSGRKVIYLLPIGEFKPPAPSVDQLVQFTESFFQLPTRCLDGIVIDPSQFGQRTNVHTKKPQIRAPLILERLASQLPADACCLLGITMWDLYPAEDWNYVFGQATLDQRVGVFSFARFDPEFLDEDRPEGFELDVLRRSCRVLAHETCHMLGMQHCIYYRCVVNGSNHRAEMDKTPLHLCPICLRKLHSALAFDLTKRDEQLMSTCVTLGLADEARWFERRRDKLRVGSSR